MLFSTRHKNSSNRMVNLYSYVIKITLIIPKLLFTFLNLTQTTHTHTYEEMPYLKFKKFKKERTDFSYRDNGHHPTKEGGGTTRRVRTSPG